MFTNWDLSAGPLESAHPSSLQEDRTKSQSFWDPPHTTRSPGVVPTKTPSSCVRHCSPFCSCCGVYPRTTRALTGRCLPAEQILNHGSPRARASMPFPNRWESNRYPNNATNTTATSGSRGPGVGPPAPLPPKIFSNSCSFEAILREKTRILNTFWAQPPPLGSKLRGPPDQNPRSAPDCSPCCFFCGAYPRTKRVLTERCLRAERRRCQPRYPAGAPSSRLTRVC